MLFGKLIGAARQPPVLEFVGSVSSTTSTINISSITATGRLCILVDNTHTLNTTIPTQVTPSNFILLRSLGLATVNSLRHTITYKILDGSESTLTGQAIGTATRKIALVFRFASGNITTVSFLPSPIINGQITGSTLAQQSLSTTGQVTPFINIGTYGTTTNRNITGLSPRDEAIPTVASPCHIHYDIVNSGTQSATMNGAGVSGLQAMMSFTVNVS